MKKKWRREDKIKCSCLRLQEFFAYCTVVYLHGLISLSLLSCITWLSFWLPLRGTRRSWENVQALSYWSWEIRSKLKLRLKYFLVTQLVSYGISSSMFLMKKSVYMRFWGCVLMSLWLFVWCLCVLVSIIMVRSSLMFGSILEEALQLCRYFVAGKKCAISAWFYREVSVRVYF